MISDNTESTPHRLEGEYHLSHEHERRKIRFDPTINTGHLLSAGTSMVASLVFVMASWAAIDKRIVVLEEARLATNIAAQERQGQTNEKFNDVKSTLSEIKASVENLRRDLQDNRRDAQDASRHRGG
jgi:outer membrane murein-binding lipoprotein Lpp